MTDLQQLEREWDQRIAAAEEEDRPQLRLERAEAIGQHWQRVAAASTRQGLLTEILAQYPRARIPEVVGNTREEIEASAKQSHDAIQAMIDEELAKAQPTPEQIQAREEAEARAAWGGSGTAGAGGTAPDPATAELDDKWDGLREAYPQDGPTGAGVTYSGKLKPGDDERIARLRLDPEWDQMQEAHVVRGLPPKPPPTRPAQ
jgi:hypothetical protein